MANHKSAAKRAKQSLVRKTRNLSTKRTVRTAERKLKSALESKEAEKAQELLKNFSSKINKAAQKGVFHAKTASRKISRLSKDVYQLSK